MIPPPHCDPQMYTRPRRRPVSRDSWAITAKWSASEETRLDTVVAIPDSRPIFRWHHSGQTVPSRCRSNPLMNDRSFVVVISDRALGASVENIGRGLLALNGNGIHSGARSMDAV